MDKVASVSVYEIGKPGRAADSCQRNDFLVLELELLEDPVEGCEHGVVTASGTPGGLFRGEVLLA